MTALKIKDLSKSNLYEILKKAITLSGDQDQVIIKFQDLRDFALFCGYQLTPDLKSIDPNSQNYALETHGNCVHYYLTRIGCDMNYCNPEEQEIVYTFKDDRNTLNDPRCFLGEERPLISTSH
tara:strand:+ start:561 stop:929 length:369 start_codon:yes stop_codon:yes gene_type:complete